MHLNFSNLRSAYDDVNEWLSHLTSREDAIMVAMDLQSHRNIGQGSFLPTINATYISFTTDFPSRVFIEHLYEITQTRFERLNPSTVSSHQPILLSSIRSALDALKEEIHPRQMELLQTYNFSVRRSPKRRSYSVTTSEQNSPEAKRPRLSASVASSVDDDEIVQPTPYMNGNRTPSPTNSTVSMAPTEEPPAVTVAMLRALTRDLKKKYTNS